MESVFAVDDAGRDVVSATENPHDRREFVRLFLLIEAVFVRAI
jgi:hypothetical protein